MKYHVLAQIEFKRLSSVHLHAVARLPLYAPVSGSRDQRIPDGVGDSIAKREIVE
jgi:hypothetical protein